MPNVRKAEVLEQLRQRFGDLRKIGDSESLFVVGKEAGRIYIRYSKLHPKGRAFFGLRDTDLRQLEGHNAYLCFLVDDGSAPLFVPYVDFEEIFHAAQPAGDGQYKVQLLTSADSLELYVARQGRFNVEGYVGLDALDRSMDARRLHRAKALTHSQVQTLLVGIGHLKGHDVYIPPADVGRLDWTMTPRCPILATLPGGFERVRGILDEIDVVWVNAGRSGVEALYEVEHSTPVYSGLLRFNDVLIIDDRVSRFSIVSNDLRRELFSRQVFRPTFRKSGLAEICSFLEYANVLDWHERLVRSSNGVG